MTQTPATGRPPQVTAAGWVAMVGSAFLVVSLYDAIARLHSLDNRELVTDLLNTSPYSGLGFSVEGWLDFTQGVFTVAGACAAAAAVCGFYVLQRSKSARIGLSVAAIPLFVSGFIPGGPFTSALVAVSAVLLWTGPARDWFAGRPVRQPAPRRPVSTPPPGPPSPGSQDAPRTGEQGGVPSMPPPVWPPADGSTPAAPGAAPYSGFGSPRPRPVDAPLAQRPPALLAACIVTWVCAAAVAGLFSLSALAIVMDPSGFDEQVAKQQARVAELGLTHADLRVAILTALALFVVWAIVAAVLALLVMLRMRWARPLLIASSVLAGLFSFASVSLFIPAITGVAGMVTAYLLMRPEVSRWINRR
jgi:hypothetical protein